MKSVTSIRGQPFHTLTRLKDHDEANALRIEGNLLFNVGKHFEALANFNKCLSVAQANSADIPLAYSDRSAVYLEVGEYELCLQNIQLARDAGFPSDKQELLDIREEDCKRLMKGHQPNPDDDLWSFFKLSYPPNEKIPFIVNCLELRKSDDYGRFVITTQDLKPGDIVAIEEPFFKTVHADAAHSRCANCVKSNKLSLIPSEISRTAMFCSNKCMETATATFLQAENDSKMLDIKQRMLFEALAVCEGSFEKLSQLMTDPELCNKTIFDFDLSDPSDSLYKYNLLVAINSLAQTSTASNEVIRYLSHHPILDLLSCHKDKEIAKAFLLRSYRILTNNSFGIEWVVPARPSDANKDSVNTILAGDGLCQFGSLLNHSCIPNVDRVFVENKFVFYVRRPIAKGQQLFICYGTLFVDAPRELRQETLLDEYGFVCACEACVGDYPASFHYPWSNVSLTISVPKVDEWKREFKKNCEKIIRKQTEYSHSELCVINLKNLYFLVAIAKTEPFIF